MNDYRGEARKRSQNLLIVEGSHEKDELFRLLFKCFPEIDINVDDIWIYGTNIYMLYDDIIKEYGSEWIQDDIDLPFVISKKSKANGLRYKEDFTNIILVFDYERHDPNFSETKILDLQNYFVDSADSGKLYINYPMIESYQHLTGLPDPDYADRKIPVRLQPGKKYKELVRNETVINQFIAFPNKVEELLNEHFGISDELQWKKCHDAILNISVENDMDKRIEEILQDAIQSEQLQTAKYMFLNQVSKLGYAHKGKSYWEYMRSVFQQIIYHNICKGNRVQNEQYVIDDCKYKDCFEGINLTEILKSQNKSSRDIQAGFIWVLNTCIFFVAEYNFGLVME